MRFGPSTRTSSSQVQSRIQCSISIRRSRPPAAAPFSCRTIDMEALPSEDTVTGEKKKTCRSLPLKERIASAATILERDGALFSETWMALLPGLQRSGIRITSARRSPCAFIRTTRISIFHLRSLETGALIPAKTYVSRYRFVAFDGAADAAELDRLWDDYANPPKVSIS